MSAPIKSARHVQLDASFPNVAERLSDKSKQPSTRSWALSDAAIVLIGAAALVLWRVFA